MSGHVVQITEAGLDIFVIMWLEDGSLMDPFKNIDNKMMGFFPFLFTILLGFAFTINLGYRNNATYEALSWACTMLGQLAEADKAHAEAKKYDPFFRD